MTRYKSQMWPSLVCLLLSLFALSPAAQAAPAAGAPRAEVRPDRVAARGEGRAMVTVEQFGRYAILAESEQGTALQLIDRMAGPGPRVGAPGQRDGRIDLFLERGQHLLRTSASPEGKGEARLRVAPFVEQSEGAPLLPDDGRITESTLQDLQQRSYWIQVGRDDEPVALELIGRALAEVRLWRDGTWLEAATPTCSRVELSPGQPLTDCTFSGTLPAGAYKVVAYGGAPLRWTGPDDRAPLWVQRGLPSLDAVGRGAVTLSAFGQTRLRVTGGSTWFRLELPNVEPATLAVSAYDRDGLYRAAASTARVTAESRLPVAELGTSGAKVQVLTLTGAPGREVVVQHFIPRGAQTAISGVGPRLLSLLRAGDPSDSADLTALLTDGQRVVAAAAIPIDAGHGWRRRFNLLGATTLFVEVKEAGSYRVEVEGPATDLQLEPWFITPPKGYAAPAPVRGSATVSLSAGFHVLRLKPAAEGIATVTLRPSSISGAALRFLGVEEALPFSPTVGVVQLPVVNLEPKLKYQLHLGQVPGSRTGLIETTLPATFEAEVPVLLRPSLPVVVPANLKAAGTLVAPLGGGRFAELQVDGGAWARSAPVTAGSHSVLVRQVSQATLLGAVRLAPPAAAPGAPLPDLGAISLPDFPVLAAGAPEFMDLEAEGSGTVALQVQEAGLYRVESTGLLATEGSLRTRTNPTWRTAAENGVGRNFVVGEYLREGDYQVTVTTRGSSAGHLGLALNRSPLRDGGALTDGVPATVALAADEGVLYRFTLAEAGEWQIRSAGPGALGRVRLEDADGWPIVTPGVEADLRVHLEAGGYRLILLPERQAVRRQTALDRVLEPPKRSGHGPFPLALEVDASHIWWESEARTPDVWTFHLPAAATVTLSATAAMVGELRAAEGQAELGRLSPDRPWTGPLPAGDYRLELRNARRNAGVEYAVRLQPEPLLVGASRAVQAPVTVPITIGAEGLVEIGTLGDYDVKARLLDAAGALVASADDGPEDWNVRLLPRLLPGAYSLVIEPVGLPSVPTTLRLRAAGEVDEPPLSAGAPLRLQPGVDVHRYPFEAPPGALIQVEASSADNVGIAIEHERDGRWILVGSAQGRRAPLALRGDAGRWRLRVWSIDQRGNPVELRLSSTSPRDDREGPLGRGQPGPILRVHAGEPGAFAIEPTPGLRWCPAAGEACLPVTGGLLPATPELWLLGEGKAKIRGRRVTLQAGQEALLPRAGSVNLAGAGGPLLVIATATAGQPRLSLHEGRRTWEAVDTAERRVVGLIPEADEALATLRPAGDTADLEMRVRSQPFPAAKAVDRPAFQVPAGEARRFQRPDPGAPFRLVLPAGLVAAILEGERVESVHAAGPAGLDLRLEAGGAVLVVNPTSAAAPAAVEALPALAALPRLSADRPLERREDHAGRLLFEVPAAPGATLHLRGVREASLLRADGSFQRGTDLPLDGAPARLTVDHGPGLWVAWLDASATEGPAAAARSLWGQTTPTVETRAPELPAVLALSGASQRVQADVPGPSLLTVRLSSPALLIVSPPGAPPLVLLHPGGSASVPVRGGAVELLLRGLAGAPLSGSLGLFASPARPAEEGLAEPVLLSAGQGAAWTIRVERPGLVGVGLRASADGAVGRLYGPEGDQKAEGIVIVEELPAGQYLYTVTVPDGGPPVVVRPRVAGLAPDPGTPPAEVVQDYVRRSDAESDPVGALP